MSEDHLSDLRFDSLELHESIQAGIRDAGFEFCTPIQASTLPIALRPSDVAGQAQTGTGKTAAFLIAAYQRLMTTEVDTGETRQPRVFVLAPTRELAVQIANDAEVLGKHTGLRIGLAFGGTDYEKQRKILQDGVDLLIGTPGRIIDYSSRVSSNWTMSRLPSSMKRTVCSISASSRTFATCCGVCRNPTNA